MPDRVADVTRIVQGGRARGLGDDQIRALVARYDERLRTPAPPPTSGPMRAQPSPDAADFTAGIGKGVVKSVVGLGELWHGLPGVSRAVDAIYGQPGLSQAAFPAATRAIDSIDAGTYGPVGETTERVGEFFLPVGAVGKAKVLAEAGKAALLTKTQGGSLGQAGVAAGLSAVVPGAGAVRRTGAAISAKAEPLVRAAVKPTVASLRRITGQGGMDAKANALVRFIIDNRLTSADKARSLFQRTEHELQRVLNVKNAPTDEPTRVLRYLDALERSAAQQRLPAQDVAAIRNAAAELVEGSLGKDVIQMVAKPHQTLVDQFGKPIMVLVPETTRVMRATTQADEAMGAARASGRWSTRKSWGELKGTDKEIKKTVERAGRDAVKTALPETRQLLRTEGQSLQSAEVLERMAARTGNRDAASLPAHVIAAGEIASGRVPVLAFAANWLRNNQMKAGIWAEVLGKAIEKGNAPLVADILKKIGVGSASQMMRTPATAQ